jgi:TIR domain
VEIFINFRGEDGGWAAALIDAKLTERFGRSQVFRDSRSIELGAHFPPVIWDALRRCSVLLAIIGPTWLTASDADVRKLDRPQDYVRREIALALQNGKRVIPVLLGDTALLKRAQLPDDIADLAERQYVRLSVRTSGVDLDRLVDDLSALLPRELGAVPADPHRNPARSSTVVVMGDRNMMTGPIVGGDYLAGR